MISKQIQLEVFPGWKSDPGPPSSYAWCLTLNEWLLHLIFDLPFLSWESCSNMPSWPSGFSPKIYSRFLKMPLTAASQKGNWRYKWKERCVWEPQTGPVQPQQISWCQTWKMMTSVWQRKRVYRQGMKGSAWTLTHVLSTKTLDDSPTFHKRFLSGDTRLTIVSESVLSPRSNVGAVGNDAVTPHPCGSLVIYVFKLYIFYCKRLKGDGFY